MRISNAKGFTLIELVVVIVILGILAAAALATFVPLQRDARIATTRGSLGTNRAVVGMAYARRQIDNNAGFNTVADLNSNTCGSGANSYNCWQTGIPRNMLNNQTLIAVDPIGTGTCTCAPLVSTTVAWFYNGGTAGTGVFYPAVDTCTDTNPCGW